ncbi:mannosyltransferase [Gamsiella multidivaricata]|nr:mannosyltransferase [Gamsiella multidivaricata]
MVPSSTPGINSRSRNDGPVADRVVPATTETSMTGTAASTTATATTATTTLKQRKISATNGHGSSNGQANGKLNGILMDRRKIVDDNNDDSQDSNSDTNSEVLDPLTGEPLRLRDYASPYCPSFSVAFKALFLVRALAATYSNISDCDEVFNFWEPMHYLQYGTGLETWEYSPVYAIRSWAYILAHALPAEITRLAMSANRPPRHHSGKRTFWAIFWVGLGALLGWPFSAAVGLPFALEELLVHSRNHSRKKTVRFRDWRMVRLLQLTTSTIVVLGCVLVPIMIIDQYYYKKLVIVPLNIVLYNVFGGDVGPDIFGTEPWWFYILNGLLNFNVLFPAALFSLPMLLITYFAIPDVLPAPPSSGGLSLKDPLLWFSLKLSPFYLWFAIFTAQPHKEERFLFVVYPLICFNAVMTLFMAQKIIQRTLDRFVTRSKTAAIHKYAAGLVWLVLLASAAVSLSRILALYEHYSAPIDVYRKAFDMVKVPGPMVVEGSDSTVTGGAAALANNRDPAKIVRVCVGKEWYRFPSHYFLPEGAKLGFLKSHFDGLLPGEFQELPLNAELPIVEARPSAARGKEHRPLRIDWRWSAERRPGTSFVPKQMNNQNMEVFEHYTPLDQCDYLVDLDYGGRAGEDESQGQDSVEPRYLQDKEHWERLYCRRFLDTKVGAGRNRWVRAFWIPDQVTVALTRGQTKVWGDYCLARRKSL